MKLLQGRAELRWLPSRHHFAIFRLIAYFRSRSIRITGKPDRVLSINRDQSAPELFGVGFWIVLTVACYFAALITSTSTTVALPFAFLIAIPLSLLSMQVLTVLAGLGSNLVRVIARVEGSNNIRSNSFAIMSLLLAAAAYFATHRTWVRFAAWQFLAAAGLNAIAAAIVFFLGGEIARLESSLGGETSASSSLRSR